MQDPQTPIRASNDPPAGEPLVRFTVDGESLCAQHGQTVAAALLGRGSRVLRRSQRRGEPRGLFCGMGVCFECVVQIDGRPDALACQTRVADGMRIQTNKSVADADD